MLQHKHKKSLGIIGGLGTLAGADLFFKLAKAIALDPAPDGYEIIFEQQPFDEKGAPGAENANATGRKLYIFDMIRKFEARQVHSVLAPCFISHTFLGELQSETRLPVISIMDALLAHLQKRFPEVRKIGVLASDYVRSKALFEQHFSRHGYDIVYPEGDVQAACVMPAIYGPRGIKAGHLLGESVDLLQQACANLAQKGAQLILPGATEIAVVSDALQERGIAIVDANQAYVQYALSFDGAGPARTFKVGVIGGVGPAATVDFLDKIIRNTSAARDQDHIKLVLEHNPQIPDRTASLLSDGPDPTVAMYSACKKLEASDADIIAIPCNTAHAFVERIQPYLAIPIVNMLYETIAYSTGHFPERKTIGLLATSGTVASGVYHDVAAPAGLDLIVPDAAHQTLVMESIYGARGVKAGFTDGECRTQLLQALSHLVALGAEVILLGCTELPLLLAQDEDFQVDGKRIVVLDPTEILARKCVQLSVQRA